jgi:hypothetical protein
LGPEVQQLSAARIADSSVLQNRLTPLRILVRSSLGVLFTDVDQCPPRLGKTIIV